MPKLNVYFALILPAISSLTCAVEVKDIAPGPLQAQQSGKNNVYNSQGGMQGWMKSGYKNKKPCRMHNACYK